MCVLAKRFIGNKQGDATEKHNREAGHELDWKCAEEPALRQARKG